MLGSACLKSAELPAITGDGHLTGTRAPPSRYNRMRSIKRCAPSHSEANPKCFGATRNQLVLHPPEQTDLFLKPYRESCRRASRCRPAQLVARRVLPRAARMVQGIPSRRGKTL